ncbi:MAG TPA: hypothetical protein VJ124_03230 [Pyrinomonadaceae bacterium]|nr:hypothetical protein [Pyrinomonadaceae bacterium]
MGDRTRNSCRTSVHRAGIGASLWEYPMRFLEASPLVRADRVETPLMILHHDTEIIFTSDQDLVKTTETRSVSKTARCAAMG